jgi:hypothetical protein
MASAHHITATGTWTVTRRDAATGRVLSTRVYKNIIPTVGRAAIAKQLTGGGTYGAAITYVAVGTGGGAPANGDTQLATELTRKAIAGASNASNVLTVDGFFNETEANGVLTEAAIFGNGDATQASATANSGILYSRVTISETKTATESLTVTWTLTFS